MNNKGAGTLEVIIIIVFFAVLMFSLGLRPLLPIVAYSQVSYFLPNQQQEQQQQQQTPENQGNQGKVMITGNESVNSSSSSSTKNNNNKVIILNFDDSLKSQFTYAKLILDRYGFKATFFEVCNWIDMGGWKDIAIMRDDGMDIQSHSMTHHNLNKLSQSYLDYEIGQSKQCFLDYGINATIFAYPNGYGSNNETVINTVAKYYNLARANLVKENIFPLSFLNCDACPSATYLYDRALTFADNKYAINSWSHNHIEGAYNQSTGLCTGICHRYNNSQMFEKFVAYANSQDNYNEEDGMKAIPIVIYHNIVTYPDVNDSKIPSETTMNLFNAEMKYLHDNGFKVLTMADLAYDANNKYLYIKSSR